MTDDGNNGTLLFERRGGVAWLTLNRPDVGNAIDIPTAHALSRAAIACDEDESVRCVVLTGAGRMFCAGGDVAGFAAAGEASGAHIKELTAHVHMAASRFARMPKPFVTAVNGTAAGVGFSLAILGDIVLAARSSRFLLAYSAIGLSPDGGSTWLLPRLVGLRRAQELALTGKQLSGDEAAALDLVTRTVDDDRLVAEAQELAGRLVALPTRALGRTRALLMSSFQNGLEEQMELEARAIAAGSRDSEGREGIAAFLAKRHPQFDPTEKE